MKTSSKPGCLASIMNLLGGKPDPVSIHSDADETDVETFPYRVRDDFLSPAEQSFYQVIKSMMGEHLTICSKVSLADIFFVVRPNENRGAFNRINRKHVDFLICDPKTMRPRFAIELDDSSHQRSDREIRDEFVDNVFEAAGLPLIHVPVRSAYNTSELGVVFKQALQQNSGNGKPIVSSPAPDQPAQPGQQGVSNRAPFCPKCGQPMVLRTAKNSDKAGQPFYGCVNYPKCREILPANILNNPTQ